MIIPTLFMIIRSIMMKKLLITILLLLCIPSFKVDAADYELKNGKVLEGTYAGEAESDYHYYKIIPSKNGFIAITATTSDNQNLLIDICDKDRNVIASDVSIADKQTVMHKVKKKTEYYVRIKGTLNVVYTISYKMKTFDTLKYAKKYSYTFTNASFTDKSNNITLKIKSSIHGNLNLMCKTDHLVAVQYLNSKKKVISNTNVLMDNSLSGIGVKADKVYYVRMWNQEKLTSGTTTIENMKYQIKSVINASNTSRGRAYTLSNNTYKESLVPADTKSTYWYKVKLSKDQKLSIFVESRILQMNGSGLQLDLYNRDGKKITSKSIPIDEESFATYKKKKYRMNYPVKNITTGELPSDTYYIRIVSKSKKTSGSFRVKWK